MIYITQLIVLHLHPKRKNGPSYLFLVAKLLPQKLGINSVFMNLLIGTGYSKLRFRQRPVLMSMVI